MGLKKKTCKDGGGKKDAGAAAASSQTIVLTVDLHCDGCARKVRKAIERAPGVESVTTDVAAGKVVVTGPADAVELKERIEARAKKPVQIVSTGAKDKEKEKISEKKADKEKASSGGEKKADKEKGGGGGGEKKADKPKEEKPEEETVTLKIQLHCDGCIDRIKRRICKFKGVKDVAFDAAKDLVKVTGTMDASALPAYLREKFSRDVKVVAPGKKDGGGEDKKYKAAAASASVSLADDGMYQVPPYHDGYYGAGPSGYITQRFHSSGYYFIGEKVCDGHCTVTYKYKSTSVGEM